MSKFKVEKIAVLGAGAIGSLFGGLLCEGGLDVTLIDIWEEHIKKIKKDGLKITGYGGDRYIKNIKATTDPSKIADVDVVIVQCKAGSTKEAVMGSLGLFGKETAAISFQNGLGNEEIIAEIIGEEKVLGGETAQGSAIIEPGVIRNAGAMTSHLGELNGGISKRSSLIAKVFTEAGLETVASENIKKSIWKN